MHKVLNAIILFYFKYEWNDINLALRRKTT